MFGKSSAVGVPEIMIFEFNVQGFLDFARVIFHRINGLNFTVRQGIDEQEGRDRLSICVSNNSLILGANIRYINICSVYFSLD